MLLLGSVGGKNRGSRGKEGAPGEGTQTQAPRASLVSWMLPGLAPQALITGKAAFPFLLGRSLDPPRWQRPWSRVAETGQEGTLWRCPTDLRGRCQAPSKPDSAQLCPLPATPGMPVDVNSAAFRLWQILNGSSFHGCIRNLYINNELQDFTKTRMKPGVVPGCEPCRKLYCLHGICQPNASPGPVCHCEAGWGGLHCDQPADSPCHGHK